MLTDTCGGFILIDKCLSCLCIKQSLWVYPQFREFLKAQMGGTLWILSLLSEKN